MKKVLGQNLPIVGPYLNLEAHMNLYFSTAEKCVKKNNNKRTEDGSFETA
jgi:hypothetical protein